MPQLQLRTARRRRRTGAEEGSGRRFAWSTWWWLSPLLSRSLGKPKDRHLPCPPGGGAFTERTFARQERCMTTPKTAADRTDGELPSAASRPVRGSMQLNLMAKATTSQPRLSVSDLGEGGWSRPHASPPRAPGIKSSGPFAVITKPKHPQDLGAGVVTTTSEKVRHDQANDHQRERVRRDPRSDS